MNLIDRLPKGIRFGISKRLVRAGHVDTALKFVPQVRAELIGKAKKAYLPQSEGRVDQLLQRFEFYEPPLVESERPYPVAARILRDYRKFPQADRTMIRAGLHSHRILPWLQEQIDKAVSSK